MPSSHSVLKIAEAINNLADAVRGRTPPPLGEGFSSVPQKATSRLPYHGIWCKDGKYHAVVHIQDGVEKCGIHNTEQQAQDAWVQGMVVLNGLKEDEARRAIPKTQVFGAVYERLS